MPRLPSLSPRFRGALLVALGFGLGLVVSLLVHALSINTPLKDVPVARAIPRPGTPGFLETIALHTDTRFDDGHGIQLLLDGAGTYPPLWDDLRAARRSVTLQLYYCQPGRLADSLAAALAVPAAAGVPVLFLYDGFGCNPLGDAYFDRLRRTGVRVRAFRPVRWWSLHRAQERSHARIAVVDGAVGYTGGFGIDDRWSGAGADGLPGWRDTNVRFTGPAVRALQAAFAEGWAEATGELLVTADFFPRAAAADAADTTGADLAPDGGGERGAVVRGAVAGLLHSTPDAGSTTAERLLALSIAAAARSVYIANAYFVPDDDFRALLVEAAERGVDVRVLTPDEDTDIPVVRYAARAHYDQLLEGGVRIWEYEPTMMHAKSFVVDGIWSSVGSMNFDNRSLAVNEETSLLALDRPLGARMDSLFLADLRQAREITLEGFRQRGLWQRIKERLAVLSSRLL